MRTEVAATLLLDRAFQLARRNGKAFPGPANARAQLAIEFRSISSSPDAREFFDAYDRALDLLSAAELLANDLHTDQSRHADFLRRLQQEHAGFEPATYDDAIAEGLFRTR